MYDQIAMPKLFIMNIHIWFANPKESEPNTSFGFQSKAIQKIHIQKLYLATNRYDLSQKCSFSCKENKWNGVS